MKIYTPSGIELEVTIDGNGDTLVNSTSPPKTYYTDEEYLQGKYNDLYEILTTAKTTGIIGNQPQPMKSHSKTNKKNGKVNSGYTWDTSASYELPAPPTATTYGVTPTPLKESGNKQELNTKMGKGDNLHEHIKLTEQQVKEVFNYGKDAEISEFTKSLNKYMEKYGINNIDALEQFLGQVGGETSGLGGSLSEDMDYNEERLKNTFQFFFKPEKNKKTKKMEPAKYNAKEYIHNAQKLGDLVYKDVGGYKYRGRGVIQLTGKDEYKAFFYYYNKTYNANLDYASEADLDKVGTNMNLAVISALWYFQKRVLNKSINIQNAKISEITKKINPHNMGSRERNYYYMRAVKTLAPDNNVSNNL